MAAIIMTIVIVSLLPAHAFAKTHAARHQPIAQLLSQSGGDTHERHFIDQQRNVRPADGHSEDHDAGQPVRISRDKAAAIARDAAGGRVLKVQLKGNRYHVRLLLDGERVRTVRVDAYTGEVR